MLQLANRTGLAGTLFVAPDPDGVDTLYAIVKGTFDISTGAPAEVQIPIALEDEFHGDPAASSIRVPSDMALAKPGTDVLLMGSAYAPGGWPAYYVDVSVQVGSLFKVVRVFGDRVWEFSGTGLTPSAPRGFERMPLIWERAFGGSQLTSRGSTSDTRNPVGRGYTDAHAEASLRDQLLPNLEDPAVPLTSPRQTPPPACFAPVAAHWEPRRLYAGTYDDAWQQSRAPYLPRDFDARFFQLAPPGLVMEGKYLQGGEYVDVRGATAEGILQFRLPRVHVAIAYRMRGSSQPRPANLDTVILLPDAQRFILVWRAAFQCDKQLLQIDEVTADIAAVA